MPNTFTPDSTRGSYLVVLYQENPFRCVSITVEEPSACRGDACGPKTDIGSNDKWFLLFLSLYSIFFPTKCWVGGDGSVDKELALKIEVQSPEAGLKKKKEAKRLS